MEYFINLICGAGLFLYGVNCMSAGFKDIFGNRMRDFLYAATKSKFRGVVTGAAVTGIIQSSCASTVMAVGFVNSGLMSLSSAVSVVMGANIGTTVTSLIVAFDFSDLAPFAVVTGTVLLLFGKKERTRKTGSAVVGFGLLFLGMNMMTSAFSSAEGRDSFVDIIYGVRGKLPCVAAGFLMTVIMQSSSATVGILQALCLSGFVDISDAVYIIFGQNIGSTVPAMIAATGTEKTAAAVARSNLIFNIAGTVLFLIIGEFISFPELLLPFTDGSKQVSAMHIFFNIASTLVLLPFSGKIADISLKMGEIRIPFLRRKKAV